MARLSQKLTCALLRPQMSTYPKASLLGPLAKEEFNYKGQKVRLFYISTRKTPGFHPGQIRLVIESNLKK